MRDLAEILLYVEELVRKSEALAAQLSDEKGHKHRRETRVRTQIPGNLVRITDLQPGEREEFPVFISDISRHGMRIRVESNYIASRIVQVSFTGPRGDKKTVFLEVVRLTNKADGTKKWYELGCCINDDKGRQHYLHEQKTAESPPQLNQAKN